MAMSSETAQLIVKVSADVANARSGISSLQGSMNHLRNVVLSVGAAVGGAFAFRDVIRTTRTWRNEIDSLTDTLGLSASAASRWNYQARVIGVTAGDLENATEGLLRRINSQHEAILQGTSDFDKWGISVLTAEGAIRPMEQIVGQLREKISALGPGLTSRAMEMELLGRSGGKLHDFLALTNEEIAKMNEEMQALGLDISGGLLEAFEQQERDLNRLGLAFDAMKVQVGNFIIPLVVRLVPILQRAAMGFKSLGEAMRFPLSIIKTLAEAVGTFAADFKADFVGALATFAGTLKDTLLEVLGRIGAKLDEFGPLGTLAKGALIALGAAQVMSAIATAAAGVAGLAGALRRIPTRIAILIDVVLVGVALDEVRKNIELIAANWENLRRAQAEGLLEQHGLLGITLARLTQWGQIFENLGTTTRSVFDGIGTAIMSMWTTVTEWIRGKILELTIELNGLILGIERLTGVQLPKIPGGGDQTAPGKRPVNPFRPAPDIPAGQFAGGVVPEAIREAARAGGGGGLLTPFARGGIVRQPTVGLVGEAGPEAIIPLSRGGLGGVVFQSGAIVIHGGVDSPERVRQLADAVADRILGQTGMRRQMWV